MTIIRGRVIADSRVAEAEGTGMIVFVAGMQRSGSTFVFNIARELLSRSGRVYAEPSISIPDVLIRSSGADHIILKSHIADDLLLSLTRHGAVKTVCTYRCVEDSVASLMDVFGYSLANSIARIRSWVRMYRHIRGFALNVPYEALRCDPVSVANRVSKNLGCADDATALAQKYSRERVFAASHMMDESSQHVVNMGSSVYHKVTYFHRRHVPSLRDRVASHDLPVDELNQVKTQLADEIAFMERCRIEDAT
jgi:hypothetical protein